MTVQSEVIILLFFFFYIIITNWIKVSFLKRNLVDTKIPINPVYFQLGTLAQ
jgi:hypothetical protein